MKDKIVSWILGAIFGWLIIFSYGYFYKNDNLSNQNFPPMGWNRDMNWSWETE